MKRPKRTNIKFTIVEREITGFQCPHCKRYVIGAGIERNVSRFVCYNCKNEIIVNEFQKMKHDDFMHAKF